MSTFICRYCSLPIDTGKAVKTYAYWNAAQPLPDGTTGNPVHWCHPECKQSGYSDEVLECQLIDADCNDCKHFKRGVIVGRNVFDGTCLRFNKPTIAQPNKWTGHTCFEHRRLGSKQ